MGSLPKTKKKNIPKSIHEMSKETLQETLKKKRECNAKALETVKRLCEASVDEEWFLKNLQFINQCHFDDATIERAITKICGYPLCDKELNKVPTQQYRISTRYNKVFDITERKNFCSSACYKSAMFIKNQLFTSPLWFRDQEVIPKYTVLKSVKSSLGEEVVFLPDRIKPEDVALEINKRKSDLVENSGKLRNSSDSSKDSEKLNNLEKSVSQLEKKCADLTVSSSESDEPEIKVLDGVNIDVVKESNVVRSFSTLEKDTNVAEHVRTSSLEKSSNKTTLIEKIDVLEKIKSSNSTISEESNAVGSNTSVEEQTDFVEHTRTSSAEKSSNKTTLSGKIDKTYDKTDINKPPNNPNKLKSETTNKTKTKVKDEPIDTITKIEKCIFEWFSLDTLFYLYGEEKLKELFKDKAEAIKEVIDSKLSLTGQNEKIEKMIQLYKLLDADLLSSGEVKSNLKPLPDYSILKEEGKTLEIKVRAFYKGELQVKKPEVEVEEKKEEMETNTDSEPIYLPLIDAHAQTALRRKIVLDRLNKVLPDLMKVINSDFILQMKEVRNLVSTFSLSAHNITFKPTEWCLVGIILIKLLGVKNKKLKSAMSSESSKNQISVILMNYELQSDYLQQLLLRLTDGENLMKKLNDFNR